jgi:Na+-transporting methylmalonyl-CoA/oxaloacetate decarboxylase gamma subunit
MSDVEGLPGQPDSVPPPRLLDRQGWSTLAAGALLLLISFTTNYDDDNLSRSRRLPTHDQIGMGLHLAALAALAGDVQLASRLRHRAANEAAEDRIARKRETAARKREAAARKREALEAAAREQRQNRALRAGALFLLEPSPLHRRFLAYIANELAV